MRGDLQITYDLDVLRLIDDFHKQDYMLEVFVVHIIIANMQLFI